MPDYISREAAIKRFTFATLDCLGMEPTILASDVVSTLQSIPAADVRPVVVCADCEYNGHCLTQEFVDDCGKIPLDRNTFFCADGKRTDDA